MIVKIFKGVWFLSLLTTLAVLLYVYASLPEEIQVMEGERAFSISRNGLFYSALGLLSVFNILVFIFSKLFQAKNGLFAAWFYGLVCFLHLFLIVALQFFNVYNSQENFKYESIGYIIYGSISLVVVWFFLWPIYFLSTRIFSKPAVWVITFCCLNISQLQSYHSWKIVVWNILISLEIMLKFSLLEELVAYRTFLTTRILRNPVLIFWSLRR